MISKKKCVMSLVLAVALLFGSAFAPATSNSFNFLSFKPVSVSAATNQFKVDGITYEIIADTGVSVIGCDAKSTVNIPSTVTYFGKSYQVQQITYTAFENNTVVTSITIPEYVTYVEADTFIGCTNLCAIHVNMYNQYYFSYSGILYNKDMTELVKYPPSYPASNYFMPSSVITVCWNAFENSKYLERINITEASTIFESTFYNCKSLKQIYVSADNNYFCSENGVLYSKDKTRLIKYPGALQNTSFTIPKGVKEITEAAFYDAVNLAALYVETGNTYIKESQGVLFDYNKTNLLQYPAAKPDTTYFVPSTVTQIAQFAFRNSKVADIRNLDGRITGLNESNFITNSSMTKINGNSTMTSENFSFIVKNLKNLEKSSIIINSVKAKVNEAQKYLNDNYQVIKNSYANASDSFIKAIAMHNWLCDNTQYVPTAKQAYGIDITGPQDIPSKEVQNNYKYSSYIQSGVTLHEKMNIYFADDIESTIYHCASGALLMPFTVCEGYARAYQLLMDSVSVQCETVENDRHEWNVVYLNGKYYSVDCCHDDNGINGYNYGHFLKTNESLMQNCSSHNNVKVDTRDPMQFDLIYNVLGKNHKMVTDEYVKANSALSNYLW